MSLLGACLYLLVVFVCSPCSAFQPVGTVRSKPLMALQATKRKQNQGNKRKPRFSQHVYKESQEKQQQQRKKTRNGRPAATSLSDLSQYAAGTPIQEQQQRPETYSKRGKPNPTYVSPSVPWNSGKSMEELESIMTNRWGTDSSKWSVDDDDDDEDYEIVYEDDDGNVVNDDEGSSSNFFFNDPQKQQPDFYDADDVGFEPKSQPTKKKTNTDLNFDNIVAAKPAGGRGTSGGFEVEDDEDEGGFFFQPPEDPARKNAPIQPPLPSKRQQSRPDLKPFARDENGNPIFLTLEQAQRNFKALVRPNDDEDEDEDLEWDVPRKTWEELGVTSEVLLNNLQRMHCTAPLAVQDKACPSIITGQDVLVGTYTGSGKTLAFMVPLIERILFSSEDDKSIKVLIVVPGRELASQVVSVARQLLEGTGRKAMLAIGGTAFNRNYQDIRKKNPTIVVGTPGRIAELIVGRPGDKNGRLKVPQLQSLVLDEFDALLEYKPHRDPTAAIVGALKQRHGNSLQSILCSATANDMLGSSKLNDYLRSGFAEAFADEGDVFVTGGSSSDDNKSKALTRVSRTVIHGVIHVDHRRFALDTLRRILHTEPLPQQILIFAENPRKVGIVVEKLEDMGIVAAALTGGSNSEKMDRAEVAKALREGYVGIVVATEMAARGLDAPLLTHVINLDLPTDASHYAHRAGRCGRGGRPGVVINLTTSPQERGVPQKFADKLGVPIHTVEARAGKLHIVEDDV